MEQLKESAQPAKLGTPGSYYMIEGEPGVSRRDLSLDTATLPGLVEFVRARKADILALKSEDHDGAMIQVDREAQDITLVMREHGGSKKVGGVYQPATEIAGSAKFSQDHLAVKALLGNKYSALQLSQTIRANRHLFSDEGAWDKLVKQLASMSFQINKIVEDTANDTKGDRKKLFQQQITNAQEVSFSLRYPIHVGSSEVDVRVDVLYEVQNATVDLALISINMVRQEREAVDAMIDDTVAKLRDHLGETIPFIELN